jgi:two-component system sensor histidine kinase/response regulator
MNNPINGGAGLPPLPGIDPAAALELMGGSHDLLIRAARVFVRDYGALPQTVASHFGAGCYAEVGRIGHTVKGAAALMGAKQLSKLAAALEVTQRGGDIAALAGLIEPFVSEMTTVLASLRQLAPREAAPAGVPDRRQALALAQRVVPLLRSADAESGALLDQLALALAATEHADTAMQLQLLFDALDTDEAADLAAALVVRLQAAP